MNPYGCRTLTGEDLEKAKKEVTPIERVKTARFIPRPYGDMPSGIGRRHEDKTTLYGGK